MDRITKRFGGITAVDDVSLTVRDGEFITVLGPSGSGKSTLLSCIAGITNPDLGIVQFGDRVVFSHSTSISVPPEYRNVGFVFQSYALWPHMTVEQNVGYPLRSRRVSRPIVRERVSKMLEIVRLGGFQKRRPHTLSGGEQQRVALARALIMEPSVLLLDEPLSNLDRKLREEMQVELRRIQRTLGPTTIHVTHDQGEAMAISDRIAVMKAGRIVQFGTPEEVYRTPKNEFVAGFVGTSNLISGTVINEGNRSWITGHGGFRVPVVRVPPPSTETINTYIVRPEDIEILHTPVSSKHNPGTANDSELAYAVVTRRSFNGSFMIYEIDTGWAVLRAVTHSDRGFRLGDRVRFRLLAASPLQNE